MNRNETRWVNDYSHFMEEYVEATDAEHHGIPRQRWGIRNGPPYPLNQETHDRVVRGEGVSASGAKYKRGRDLQRERAKKHGGVVYDDEWKYGSMLLNQFDQDWEDVQVRYRSDGSPVYVTAARVIKDFLNDTGSLPAEYDRGYTGLDYAWLHTINPDYGQTGTTNNCTKCTAAVELLKRGIQVCAGGQVYPASSQAFTYWFKNAEQVHSGYDDTFDTIKNFGNYSSGALDGRYPGGGGYAVHYEYKDNTLTIRDGQCDKKFDSFESACDFYGFDKSKQFGITRLDNCEPDWDAMDEDSVIKPYSNMTNGVETKVRNARTGRIVDRW